MENGRVDSQSGRQAAEFGRSYPQQALRELQRQIGQLAEEALVEERQACVDEMKRRVQDLIDQRAFPSREFYLTLNEVKKRLDGLDLGREALGSAPSYIADRFRYLQDLITPAEKRVQELRQELRFPSWHSSWLVALSIMSVFVVIGGVVAAAIRFSPWIHFATFFSLATISWPSAVIERRSEIKRMLRDLERETEHEVLLAEPASPVERKAQERFRLNELALQRYYDQTLRHNSMIFVVGLVCIALGFLIIGATLYALISGLSFLAENGSSALSEKIIVGAVGTVATILTDFIGAMYIRMNSDTVKSLTEFHNRLVLTHHLHFGNLIAAQIDTASVRENTMARMAIEAASPYPVDTRPKKDDTTITASA